jgi:hypothetical protein
MGARRAQPEAPPADLGPSALAIQQGKGELSACTGRVKDSGALLHQHRLQNQ